jgi:cation transport protein ChaC
MNSDFRPDDFEVADLATPSARVRDTAYCRHRASASPKLWSEAQIRASLDKTLATWDGHSDLWVFAYGSLLWKPEFKADESRTARIFGHHRSLCLLSTVNRGTLAQPGLVLALDAGGCCNGLVQRISAYRARAAFLKLWRREMVRGSYTPQWVQAHTAQGPTAAIAFVMNRRLATYAGRLPDETIAHMLQRAVGKCGSSADYLQRTVDALDRHGLRDHRLRRYVRLLGNSSFDL